LIISVASGKGGTGKTSVAVNMAISVRKVQLLDCDVEEPNAHLLLHPEIIGEEPVYTLIPSLNERLCDQCGKCSNFCQYNAIFAPMKKF
jgi:MinD superfamily P-loop ATPase